MVCSVKELGPTSVELELAGKLYQQQLWNCCGNEFALLLDAGGQSVSTMLILNYRQNEFLQQQISPAKFPFHPSEGSYAKDVKSTESGFPKGVALRMNATNCILAALDIHLGWFLGVAVTGIQ